MSAGAFRPWLLLTLVVVLSVGAAAEFISLATRNVPIERVARNLRRLIAERPRDLQLRINLARVYAMGFAEKRTHVPVAAGDKTESEVWFSPGDLQYQQFGIATTRDAARNASAREYLSQAIAAYKEVLALEPNEPTVLLGLGWCLSQAGERGDAVAVLRKSADLAWQRESRRDASIPWDGRGYLEETARYLIPLLDPVADAAELTLLRDRLKSVDEHAGRWITPIAVPLAPGLTALDIVDADARVRFDLDGRGPHQWEWLMPNAAWLVFDRHRTGTATSGLDLFGNVTFWLFWRNGYDALAALDDDGDGEIRGTERNGFALWHDRNQNGTSERGEVRPLADWGIEALSTRYSHDSQHPDEIAWSRAGVRFADGQVRPTFDVVLRRR